MVICNINGVIRRISVILKQIKKTLFQQHLSHIYDYDIFTISFTFYYFIYTETLKH